MRVLDKGESPRADDNSLPDAQYLEIKSRCQHAAAFARQWTTDRRRQPRAIRWVLRSKLGDGS